MWRKTCVNLCLSTCVCVSVCLHGDKTGAHAWTQMDSGKSGGVGGGCCFAFSGPAAPASCLLQSPLVIA